MNMSARKSIHIDGLSHLTGIPVATRIGPLLISSVIAPFDPGTRQVPDRLSRAVREHFSPRRRNAEGGRRRLATRREDGVLGAGRRSARCMRGAVERTIPGRGSRPARHTHVAADAKAVSASFIAYIRTDDD